MDLLSIPYMLDSNLNVFLFIISSLVLAFVCFKLVISQSLIESVILMSVFSLLLVICYLFMDAPDVAMTEVSLGVCLSTCVLLNLIKIFGDKNGRAVSRVRIISAAFLCFTFILFLAFASLDLPLYGEANSPVQSHLTKYYLENTKYEIAIPSIVTAILASYRGYDTLGETTVILIAGLGVSLILARRKE